MLRELVLETFQGPLDLLLHLIEDAKLSITEVSLGKVTEQFFKHLEGMGDEREYELADFLVVGTKLVYLKSKELLPNVEPEAPEGMSLADQLKIYKRFADASKDVARFWNQGLIGYERLVPVVVTPGFYPPANVDTSALHKSFERLLRRLAPPKPLPQVQMDKTVSVKQKMQHLYDAIKQMREISFTNVLGESKNRTDIIISFLAVLELVKQSKVFAKQTDAFGDLMLQKI